MPRVPGVGTVLDVVQAQVEALTALPGTLAALTRAVRGLTGSLERSRDTIETVQRLAVRLEALLDDIEEPVRELAPGVRRLATVLDDPVVDELPDLLRRLRDDLLPVVANLRDTQRRIATIASSTERITTLVDDTGARLGALPLAGLLRRPFRVGDPLVDDPADPDR